MIRLLICGSRNWTDGDFIHARLSEIASDVEVVIEGGQRGADRLGREAAERLNLTVLSFPADWDLHGKAAGRIRNKRMLRDGRPTLVWAFHEDPGLGRGTRHMVSIARRTGMPCRVFSATASCDGLNDRFQSIY